MKLREKTIKVAAFAPLIAIPFLVAYPFCMIAADAIQETAWKAVAYSCLAIGAFPYVFTFLVSLRRTKGC